MPKGDPQVSVGFRRNRWRVPPYGLDPQEWRAAYIVVKRCPLPLAPPRLGEVILLVASLGGYFARKHDGPPGAKAMWTGLQRLRDFVIALDAQQDVERRCV